MCFICSINIKQDVSHYLLLRVLIDQAQQKHFQMSQWGFLVVHQLLLFLLGQMKRTKTENTPEFEWNTLNVSPVRASWVCALWIITTTAQSSQGCEHKCLKSSTAKALWMVVGVCPHRTWRSERDASGSGQLSSRPVWARFHKDCGHLWVSHAGLAVHLGQSDQKTELQGWEASRPQFLTVVSQLTRQEQLTALHTPHFLLFKQG